MPAQRIFVQFLNYNDYSYFLSLKNNKHNSFQNESPHFFTLKAKYFVEMLWAKRVSPPKGILGRRLKTELAKLVYMRKNIYKKFLGLGVAWEGQDVKDPKEEGKFSNTTSG